MSADMQRSREDSAAPTDMIAFAYRSGHIGFCTATGHGIPDGALFIGRAQEKKITSTVRGLARLAYDNETWLVPGCPEAANDEDAYNAFVRFFERVQTSLGRDSNVGPKPKRRRARK